METTNSPVPIAAVSYQKFHFLTMTQLAEVTDVAQWQLLGFSTCICQ